MIQVGNLYKAYGQQTLFADVSFSLNAGERVGLVGRNGHGKTTLFRIILGEEQPDAGTVSIPQGYRISHLSQHLRFSEETVLEEACLSLPPVQDGRDETFKAKAILQGLGFSPADFDRSPSELSGGFQVRLNLAKALVGEPNLLLLDEPTNYLDILSIRWLTQFLRTWKNEMIMITHDRDFMDSVTTHTMGIHRCSIRKIAGPTGKLYDQILLEEEVYERTRINDEKKRREAEQFINRFRAQATRARAVQSKIKALQRRERIEKMSETGSLDFEFRSAPFLGRSLIEAENLTFSFNHGDSPLIDGLTLSIGKDDRIGIVGKNGRGKTTLLNLLAGELTPVRGTVRHHPHLRLGYFGQTNIDRLDSRKTVLDEILDVHPDSDLRAARAICGVMMFEGDAAMKRIDVLSGGERSRVLLGKLLVSPTNLLLLDEPTNHLDMESVDSLLEAIDAFEGAVLIVTHSEMILNAIATRLIVFDGGKVRLFEGTYQDFLERVGWKEEEAAPGPAGGQVAEREGKVMNKKDLRRARAEVIAIRSRVLGGLQSSIAAAEAEIMQLEREIADNTGALVKASEKGDWQEIARLSKAIREANERIDHLFDELGVLTGEFERRKEEFDGQLNEIQRER